MRCLGISESTMEILYSLGQSDYPDAIVRRIARPSENMGQMMRSSHHHPSCETSIHRKDSVKLNGAQLKYVVDNGRRSPSPRGIDDIPGNETPKANSDKLIKSLCRP